MELTQPQHNSISAPTSLPLVLFRCTQFAPMKLIYNPGGFASSLHSQKYESGFSGSRAWYTNSEKLNIISVVQKLMQNELLSLVQAAAVDKIDPSMICRWLKNVENLRADPRKALKMAAHAGPMSVIAEIEQDLLDFIEMWHQKGFDVNRFTLLRKAKELKPDVLELSEGPTKICLSHFLAKNQLTHRVATHTAQRDPCVVEAEALDFLEYICPRLEGWHRLPDYIINMDQTPVYCAMCSGRTIDLVGVRKVNLR
jgi:hypothetical protein